MLLVVVLTVRRDRAEDFHRFETAAARIMARHGGAIERTVRLDDAPPTASTAGAAPVEGTVRLDDAPPTASTASAAPVEGIGADPRAAAVPETFREVHLVRFSSEDAFRAYRADPELASLAPLRAASITAIEIWPGTDGPTYGEPRAAGDYLPPSF